MDKRKAVRIIREVRDIYNSIAKEWDISRDRPSGIKMKVLDLVKPGAQVLDLGSGNGFMAPYVVQRGAKYFGLDISKNLVEIAKRANKELIKKHEVSFKVGGATKLPYKDNSFDLVFSFAVLHHIPSDELRQKFFTEAARVLKPGGQGMVIVWNLLNDWPSKRFKVKEQLAKQGDLKKGDVFISWKATEGKVYQRYLYQFEKKEITNLVKQAGLGKIKVEYFNRAGKRMASGEELVVRFKK